MKKSTEDWDHDVLEYYDIEGPPRKREIPPEGHVPTAEVKPRCSYYHYSNKRSQGALICQTPNFPDHYNPKIHELWSAYSDRVAGWDYDRYQRVCQKYGGDQVWSSRLPGLSKKQLKEFAKEILELPEMPIHVRVVHWFNVSNGYSCPTVEAIFNKREE